MPTAANAMHIFPLSPPSSGNVSAISSPRLQPALSHHPHALDKLIAASSSSSFRQSRSLASSRQHLLSNASDSEGYTTETSPSNHTRRKRAMTRVSALPSALKTSSKSAKPLPRTSSVSSSDSSSSSSTPNEGKEIHLHHTPNPAIGRKVAASLELFKETAPLSSEEPVLPESSSRAESVSARIEDVPEAFEFVKRSEWADRERDRSSTILEKSQRRDSVSEYSLERRLSCKEFPLQDVAQWRRDVALARGRRRERTTDDLEGITLSTINNLHNRYAQSSPCGYPLSPSPSRSPASRIPLPHLLQDLPPVPPTSPVLPTIHTPLPSSPSSPARGTQHLEDHPPPLSPYETVSPWSTDDESNWETASATPTIASNSPLREFAGDEDDLPFSSSLIYSDHEPCPSKDVRTFQSLKNGTDIMNPPLRRLDDDTFAFDVDLPEERLPHIPLRPFRNKVGGHSAIYKFTKQAVCKVRVIQSYFRNFC
jgi:inositol-hexakisphosphate kinase